MVNWSGPLRPSMGAVPGLEGHVAIRAEAAPVGVEKPGQGLEQRSPGSPRVQGLAMLGAGSPVILENGCHLLLRKRGQQLLPYAGTGAGDERTPGAGRVL